MSKRIKTVFGSAEEVCHLWAHQTQETAKSSNCYFNGDTVYSYGSHFPMGKIVTRKGQTAVLLTTRDYSNTTAKHKGYARGATRHMTQFFVPVLSAKPREQFDTYQPRVLEAMEKAGKARTNREWHINHAAALVAEANRFAEFFGLKPRLTMPENVEAAVAEAKRLDDAAKRRESARITRENNARIKREAAAKAEALEDVELWRKGEKSSIRNSRLLDSVALRITADGSEVESSQHATVPVAHAQRAYRIGLRYIAKHAEYHRNGTVVRVGHYSVDSMDTAGHIRIGCHNIEWAEVERLAKLAGWDATPAAEGETTPEPETV